jgi:hypothetical protein
MLSKLSLACCILEKPLSLYVPREFSCHLEALLSEKLKIRDHPWRITFGIDTGRPSALLANVNPHQVLPSVVCYMDTIGTAPTNH